MKAVLPLRCTFLIAKASAAVVQCCPTNISLLVGLVALWKQRFRKKAISYDSTPLTFDLLWPETYESNRFLIENIPPRTSADNLSLHLKAQEALEGLKVTLKLLDGGGKAVVFANNDIIGQPESLFCVLLFLSV